MLWQKTQGPVLVPHLPSICCLGENLCPGFLTVSPESETESEIAREVGVKASDVPGETAISCYLLLFSKEEQRSKKATWITAKKISFDLICILVTLYSANCSI